MLTSNTGSLKIRTFAVAASLAMLALGGCSSQNADVPPAQPVQVNFALDKCQQLDANLYKCPAIDQPICTPQFVRTDVNCVHIGAALRSAPPFSFSGAGRCARR